MIKKSIIAWNAHTIRAEDILSDFSKEAKHIPKKCIVALSNISHLDVNHSSSHKKLATTIRRTAPRLDAYAKNLMQRVKTGFRCVVVKKLPFSELPQEIRNHFIVGFCSLMGNPTPTDQIHKKIIWPVAVDAKNTDGYLTFSQHNHKAGFHTDSQYFVYPEDVATLWCVYPDKYGMGINGLIDGRYVVQQLATLADSPSILQTLLTTIFPFRVPTIFMKHKGMVPPEITKAPILAPMPFIRYRLDAILEGFRSQKKIPTKKQQKALDAIEAILKKDTNAFNVFLEKNDILMVNNHEVMHSRSSFRDKERLLLRVRFNF